MKEEYTLTVYAEDQMGTINKIAIMFLRKKINLKSLNISSCEIDMMYRFTIVVNETSEIVKNLKFQIEKIIEVFKCYCSTNQEIISSQTAMYKVSTDMIMNEANIDHLMRQYNARFLIIEKDYAVFEATGQENEIDNLTKSLNKFGLIEVIKTSRIALIKSCEGFAVELLNM
ncbi:acetolactate synthase small subunit [Flavobacterium sp. 90]|uniref:acetolactate synthase small subunit n=1 Tax=unclassified Flavobacterium TaxID=196869 RepID=UPI000EB2270C|nr:MULTISPECIES: acetolactate synthase small subunit [unclassified Flavobacterium]RKR08955.1 acetolactate synthase small subunit [Flavobacterium sp. 81]TCK52743.1 acetolactate synthase small subunit [Flavobacterium sp. 90]